MTPEMAVSRDGTPIAYWRSGQGPPLLLVHGATSDHSRWQSVLPFLTPHVTVCTMDRRGRGASGDADGYRVEDEGADVAAVVDAIDGPVDVLGHSYGGICALEASLRTTGMRRLVLYEAGIGSPTPPGFTDRIARLLTEGRREEIITSIYDLIGMPSEQQEIAMSLPSWQGRVKAAHTVVRELRVNDSYQLAPDRFADLSTPVLLLAGSDSPPDEQASTARLAEQLPGARVATMAGQGHVAMLTGPPVFATEVLEFLTAT